MAQFTLRRVSKSANIKDTQAGDPVSVADSFGEKQDKRIWKSKGSKGDPPEFDILNVIDMTTAEAKTYLQTDYKDGTLADFPGLTQKEFDAVDAGDKLIYRRFRLYNIDRTQLPAKAQNDLSVDGYAEVTTAELKPALSNKETGEKPIP